MDRKGAMTAEIYLDKMRFHARHGVLPQERVAGNWFEVSLCMTADIGRAAATDEVTDTVNYAEVYEVLKQEMQQPSQLLEHLAARMARRLLDGFPGITRVDLRVEKLDPPMGADIRAAGVHLSMGRDD